MKPATRRVVHRSPSHTVRQLNLPYLQLESIDADSAPERGFAHTAALFPFTSHIKHQPFKFVWDDRTYTPDFLVSFNDGSRIVVEVKPEVKISEYAELFDRAAADLKKQSIPFLVASDRQIELENLAANALRVRRYGKASYPSDICEKALELVRRNHDGVPIRNAKATEEIPPEVFMHLVTRRQLMLDRKLNVGANARVFPIQQREETSHAIHFAEWFDFQIWE